jgi:hypothetical protein
VSATPKDLSPIRGCGFSGLLLMRERVAGSACVRRHGENASSRTPRTGDPCPPPGQRRRRMDIRYKKDIKSDGQRCTCLSRSKVSTHLQMYICIEATRLDTNPRYEAYAPGLLPKGAESGDFLSPRSTSRTARQSGRCG